MTARTHDLAAAAALAVAVLLYPPADLTLSTALVALLANQLGGIAPDIDQPTAPFWRNLPSTRFVGKIFSKLSGGHRFLSHSILGVFAFGFLSKLLLTVLQPIMPHVDIQLVWYAFLIGYVSHLVMDSFTKEGVPWLLPLTFKLGFPPVRRMRVTTGKGVEAFIVFPLLLLVVIWIFASNYDAFVGLLRQVAY